MRPFLVAVVAFAGFMVASYAYADAALSVCDNTHQPVAVAIAVMQPSASGVQTESEGWFQIRAHECARVIDTPLNPAARYYLYAKSQSMTWSGSPGARTKDAQFCTNFSSRFFYFNRAAPFCFGDQEQMLWFIDEATKGTDWTINLYSP